MKKFLLSFCLIIAFAFYALFASSRSTGAVSTAPEPVTEPIASGPKTPVPVTVIPQPKTVNVAAAFKDGTYTGPATDAYFGTVQVQATVAGGKLTDVAFLQYPTDRGTSVRISNNAMPVLKSEAIKAQSAKVDIVSGATQTSQAFIKSLGSALADAAN